MIYLSKAHTSLQVARHTPDQWTRTDALPAYHPSIDLIRRYAAGRLPPGPALTVALHVEVCLACAEVVGTLEEAEGQRLLSLPGAPLKPDALERVLHRLDGAAQPEAKAPAEIPDDIRLPVPLVQIGLSPPCHLTPDAWVAHLDAPRVGGWRTYLFCAPADTPLPEHGHAGDELIQVLEGGFSDGRQFRQGDFAENKAGFVHAMQVSTRSRLVALISSGGPIQWQVADRGIGERLDI